jgi:ribosomal protein S18 acetylase RimI-like enzyme
MRVARATNEDDVERVRLLLREYAAEWSGCDLGTEPYEAELAALPGAYAPPDGCLLLAADGGRAAGCVGLRRLSEGVCEMKRLYVVPEFRRSGAGRALAEAVVAEARELGYARMRLDTMPSMTRAQALYRSLGFVEIDPYNEKTRDEAVFMELELGRSP